MTQFLFGITIWQAELSVYDNPTFMERAVTAILGGLRWPLDSMRAEPSE